MKNPHAKVCTAEDFQHIDDELYKYKDKRIEEVK